MPVVDNAIYQGGRRVATPASLEETFETREAHGGFAWIGLYRPTDGELDALASEFGLHPLAIEDTKKGHQRAKLERYGDTLFVVLRPARYLDDVEQVEFGELHVFIGPDFAITIRHAESPDLARVRRRLEASPDLLAKGPEAVLYAVLDEVVDEYSPVDAGLENDIDEIEEQLFSGDPQVTRRIYDLASEVMEFQRATRPLVAMFDALERGFEKYAVDLELQRYLRDVKDHVIRIVERGDTFRQLLQNALQVHSTLVAQRQNEEIRVLSETALAQSEQSKKISSWAAIIFAPEPRRRDLRHELRLHARTRLSRGATRSPSPSCSASPAGSTWSSSAAAGSERMPRGARAATGRRLRADAASVLPAASDRGYRWGMTEITDDLPARLLHEEHAGWKAILDGRGGEHYQRSMTRDALMVVEGAMLGRDEILAAFRSTPPWESYELHEPAVIRLGDRAGMVVYRAVARRGGDTVNLRMSTTYLYDDGAWHVAAHQQTPA